jgi:hypothetical protein
LEIIADNLSKAGRSWGWVSAVDSQGRTIWIADAHHGNGKRLVMHADEKLTAFVELKSAIRACGEFVLTSRRDFHKLDVVNGSESGGGLPSPRSVLRLFRTRNHPKQSAGKEKGRTI